MKPKSVLLLFALGLLAAQPAAAEPPAAPDPEPWRFNVASYGWAVGITGNVTTHGQTLDVSASTIDLLQKSDSLIGFMGYFEADKGRVGFYSDLVFAKLGFGTGQTSYRNPLPGLSIASTTSTALTYSLFIAEMGGLYEVARWPGASEGSATALDGLLGFRYWNNSVEANFTASGNVNVAAYGFDRSFGLDTARAGGVQWVDPLVGFRLRHTFTPRQQITLRGDIGGFGLGSQITWQAIVVYSYAWQFPGHQVAALLGFRALGVNYSSPSGAGASAVGINEILYGPLIGVSFRF